VNGVRNKRLELLGRDWIEQQIARITSAGIPRFTWSEFFTRFLPTSDGRYDFMQGQIALLRGLATVAAIVILSAVLVSRFSADTTNNANRKRSTVPPVMKADQLPAELSEADPIRVQERYADERSLPPSVSADDKLLDETPTVVPIERPTTPNRGLP
jgi:hypothetical protein